ncbi:MAG: antibiotic biosynthesis monooxygenase [Thaumarchaeota archaeon]|nr:antibiotic biosynthesis monooxygenase [Nitrososphaerota archaeon]
MKLRLVQFSLGPGKREAAEGVAGAVVPLIRKQQGCERCEFFADHEKGDYGIVVIWSSAQAADAAAAVVGPAMAKAMAKAKGVPEIRLFDVYQPK